MQSDNGPADKRKMQVLPGKFGGQFDKDPLNLDDSEHRRKQAAVEVKSPEMQNICQKYIVFPGDFEDHEGPGQAGRFQ